MNYFSSTNIEKGARTLLFLYAILVDLVFLAIEVNALVAFEGFFILFFDFGEKEILLFLRDDF